MHQSLPRHLEDWNEENVREFFHACKKPVLTEAGDYLREVYSGGHQLKVQKNLLDSLTRGQTVTTTWPNTDVEGEAGGTCKQGGS